MGIKTKLGVSTCGTKWLNSPKIVKMMLCRDYLVAGAVSGDGEARSMSPMDLWMVRVPHHCHQWQQLLLTGWFGGQPESENSSGCSIEGRRVALGSHPTHLHQQLSKHFINRILHVPRWAWALL